MGFIAFPEDINFIFKNNDILNFSIKNTKIIEKTMKIFIHLAYDFLIAIVCTRNTKPGQEPGKEVWVINSPILFSPSTF
jgi:hypothetical protein